MKTDMTTNTDDLRIQDVQELRLPEQVIGQVPVSAAAADTVTGARDAVRRIIAGTDDRIVVVVGPCSIHDPEAARDYAAQLNEVRQRHENDLCIIMRVYFEKPRTTVGWKGLINDPAMDNSFQINRGLELARSLLLAVNEMGLAAGCRIPRSDQPAVHCRSGGLGRDRRAHHPESQGHRELASGLSCPVGVQERYRLAVCRSRWMRSARRATRTVSCR